MSNPSLPKIIAGPILRQMTPNKVVLWLVCSQEQTLYARVAQHKQQESKVFPPQHSGHIQLGQHAHMHLLEIPLEQTLEYDTWAQYDIGLETQQGIQWLKQTLPDLCYEGESQPHFLLKSRMNQVLHGSCRKPHYTTEDESRLQGNNDGLISVDQIIETARQQRNNLDAQPAILLMSGDQVYVDDVAAPMLHAIHQVIALLGLHDEQLEGAIVHDSCELYVSSQTYYGRAHLLPDDEANVELQRRFFRGAKKPIFTTANADNHLITLAEVIAMYLLVWSPQLWSLLTLDKIPQCLEPEQQCNYQDELEEIQRFQANLSQVQRALAAIPTYMIFDDHDVTDDWNLTRAWEETAYGHPFSKRIIGNALMAYFLCQAWGNATEHFPTQLTQDIQQFFKKPNPQQHNQLIDQLLAFDHWHYGIDTKPYIVVLDTRTQRWWSESRPNRPSGLMDWENLTKLQMELLDKDEVILVSAAPIFGVKLIEVVQSIFTYFGHALTVDAENWMAHPGSGNTILNIFRHARTPQNFIILSGDVHYSFVYDVALRHYKTNPNIWQITSSGIKNEFPHRLLRLFDRLNRILFSANSPLNKLTRRRAMKIQQRRPSNYQGRYQHQRLLNSNSIGRVWIDNEGKPYQIETVKTNGEIVQYLEGHQADWVH